MKLAVEWNAVFNVERRTDATDIDTNITIISIQDPSLAETYQASDLCHTLIASLTYRLALQSDKHQRCHLMK